MREILFRGLREDGGGWVEGDVIHRHYFTQEMEKNYYGIAIKEIGGKEFDVIPKTIGQYTGRNDKNEKKAFDGDIIKGKDHFGRDRFGVIKYSGNSSVFFFVAYDGYLGEYLFNIVDIEIIGNITDNPELLEEK